MIDKKIKPAGRYLPRRKKVSSRSETDEGERSSR